MKLIHSILIFPLFVMAGQLLLPVNLKDRSDLSKMQLTAIGKYGLVRKARKNIPSHLHTGIDIKRPNNNYLNEPVFSIAEGVVISKRTDGPYAQLIIEHELHNKKCWSLYEHIAGITVNVNDHVTTKNAIARYMTKEELTKYGWQFDHFHLEILKIKPLQIKTEKTHPDRHYTAYSLICFNTNDLEKYYYDPYEFLKKNLITK